MSTLPSETNNPVSLRFATEILRRLGEELNPSLDQGILELVKNSYDADARVCTVKLLNANELGGRIVIADDGDGMSAEAVRDGWLVLGKSSKTTKERTRLNRIPAGNKGLGRLAALRMGHIATVTTRPRPSETHNEDVAPKRNGLLDDGNPATEGKDRELTLRIDWDKYDRADMVEDVTLFLKEGDAPAGATPGTTIELVGLRESVNRMEVKRLARAMILLADPFSDDPDAFVPRLEAPEFADLEKLVQGRYFTDCDYHLSADLRADGTAIATVADWRGNVLFEAEHSDIWDRRRSESDTYQCPPAHFDLWVFIFNKQSFAFRSSTIAEVREWIQTFGGVHLYINNLRVSPYGNLGNDWLDINLRRGRSPEERPGTNTSIGRIQIEDTEGMLLQKTDRSGLMESVAFQNIRFFAQDAMDWMARRRLQEAEKRRRTERTRADTTVEEARQSVRASINAAPEAAQADIRSKFEQYDERAQNQIKALRDEIQLYRTLSTAGITAATFAHESNGGQVKVLRQNIMAIERRAAKAVSAELYAAQFENCVTAIKKAIKSLSVLSAATLQLVNHDKRRPGRIDVNQIVQNVLDTFRPFTDGRDVNVTLLQSPQRPFLLGTEAAIESILTNLLNNSLAAFERASSNQRLLQVTTAVESDRLYLTVSDNGPGIIDIDVHDIWLPGETRTSNGTGLGLTIVRDACADLGGSVSAQPHGPLGGATITVKLPIIGASA